jgi:ATP-binding cassette, subfamily F, member 3
LEKVTYRYLNAKEDVLKGVDLIIHPGAIIGVAGMNGSGKSTLVNLIIGSDKDLVLHPTKGTITQHPRARIGHYSQHAVERIEKVGLDNPSLSALSYFLDLSNSELNEQDIRALLSGLGLRGKIVSDVPISALWGGQRVRLALAEAIWQSPHLLILDEVTTPLDSDTIIALIEMLQPWEGALLVVTHDRFFMRCVAEGESLDTLEDSDGEEVDSGRDDIRRDLSPGVVYRMMKGTLKMLEGGMDTYERLMQQRIAKLTAS